MRKLDAYLVVDWRDLKHLVEIIMENHELIVEKEELDPKQTSVIDFVVAQEGNFYIDGEDGIRRSDKTGVVVIERFDSRTRFVGTWR